MTSSDPLDDLLDLESEFYQEGYDAGVADSTYAGLIEGKVFGIEKGFEKALELGKLQGRAITWNQRLAKNQGAPGEQPAAVEQQSIGASRRHLPSFSQNPRLKKHVDNLLALTDPATLPKDNSDPSVTEVDERITKSKARAKMISTMVGESLNPGVPSASSIEDSTGLSARH